MYVVLYLANSRKITIDYYLILHFETKYVLDQINQRIITHMYNWMKQDLSDSENNNQTVPCTNLSW